jgi:hypothetical protein
MLAQTAEVRRRLAKPADGELTIEEVILTRDWVRLRMPQTLVGFDVIFVHRLLKNPVQIPEYVLLSEELYRTGDAGLPEPVHEVSQDLEGIGPVRSYFVDVEDLAGPLPPAPDPSASGTTSRRSFLRR